MKKIDPQLKMKFLKEMQENAETLFKGEEPGMVKAKLARLKKLIETIIEDMENK